MAVLAGSIWERLPPRAAEPAMGIAFREDFGPRDEAADGDVGAFALNQGAGQKGWLPPVQGEATRAPTSGRP